MKISTVVTNFASRITSVAVAGIIAFAPIAAVAADNWKDSFDEICGKVQNADSLSDKELSAMLDKADKLVPVIQASDDPGKKVYLQRLKRCRGVYEFMIDSKKN